MVFLLMFCMLYLKLIDDPWCQKKRKKKESPRKKKKEKKKKKDKDSKKNASDDEDAVFDKALAKAGLLNKTSTNGFDGRKTFFYRLSCINPRTVGG